MFRRTFFVIVLSCLVGACSDTENGDGPTPTPLPIPPVSDRDHDGVSDDADNCVSIWNEWQEDDDRDGIGNICDASYEPPVTPPLGNEFSIRPRVIIGFFTANDQEPDPTIVTRMQRAIDGYGSIPGVRTLMRRYSYGAYTNEYVFLDWMELPESAAYYRETFSQTFDTKRHAEEEFAKRGYDSDQDALVTVYIGEQYPSVGICRAGGSVMLAGEAGACLTPRIIAHELLHLAWMPHAEGNACSGFLGGTARNIALPLAGGEDCGDGEEEGANFAYFSQNVMGNGTEHPAAPAKYISDWFSPGQVVVADDDVVVSLEAIEPAGTGRKAVRVPFGDADPNYRNPAYWVEYRTDSETYVSEQGYVRIWAAGDGLISLTEEWPLLFRIFTFVSADHPYGLVLTEGNSFHDVYRGVKITFNRTLPEESVASIEVAVERSDLRSYPGALAIIRPNQSAVVRFVNEGEGTIQLQTATLMGAEGEFFSIDDDDCSGAELSPGAECGVLISSAEGVAAQSVRNAVLEFVSDDPLRPMANHALRMIPLSWDLSKRGAEAR